MMRVIFSLAAALLAATSAYAVSIRETEHEGRPHFKVETASATYYYDLGGGGFSSMIDRDGVDWIQFHTEPAKGKSGAAGAYRGIPNLVYGKTNPDAGVGHPGFEKCVSSIVASDAIRTVSKSGRWAFSWRFTEENAVLTIEQADPEFPYWFLYEGTIGGRWSPETLIWGADQGGQRHGATDSRNKTVGTWRWAYFGDEAAPRVLVTAHANNDAVVDSFWSMGSTRNELESPDGMGVFGYGRGGGGPIPLLKGPGNRFVIGFVEEAASAEGAHQRIAKTAWQWRDAARQDVRVSETTLFGDMNCFRIETPSATYLYARQGAALVSLLDPQGRDWIGYHHGGKATGQYRGIPKATITGGYFHGDYGFNKKPADNPFTSTVTLAEPGHARIRSVTLQGDGECLWDFYPDHATLTLLKTPDDKFWFTYEGAPGGSFDVDDDFTLRPDGTKTPLSEQWTEVVPWALIGAKESPHGLLFVNHQTGSPVDSYTPFPYALNEWNKEHQMAVFAFGRSDWRDKERKHVPQFTELPARFSLAVTPEATLEAAHQALQRIGTPAAGDDSTFFFQPRSSNSGMAMNSASATGANPNDGSTCSAACCRVTDSARSAIR